MYQMKILSLLAVATVLVLLQEADARPYRTLSRQKRISDQRLAELETLIALSQMKNKLVTVPVGFGKIDPLKIGRRKRSVEELLRTLQTQITSQEDIEKESELDDDIEKQMLLYDDSQRIARYRHLPVRLTE